MKIKYISGDALTGPESVLIHGCNNRGVMGSGIAKTIREKYPASYDFYKKCYQRDHLPLGSVYTWFNKPKTIIHCITQNGYGTDKQYADYDAIRQCIIKVNRICTTLDVAMPKIGAGLAGGDWTIIEKIIEEESTNFKPIVYVL